MKQTIKSNIRFLGMEKEGNDLPQFECVGLKQGKQASLKSTNSEPY